MHDSDSPGEEGKTEIAIEGEKRGRKRTGGREFGESVCGKEREGERENERGGREGKRTRGGRKRGWECGMRESHA